MWESIVQSHSNEIGSKIIHDIQRAKHLTMDKIIRAIIEEQIHPFTLVSNHEDKAAFMTSDAFFYYDKVTGSVTVNDETITDPLEFLKWCAAQSTAYDYTSFIAEIENHLINQSLSFIHCAHIEKADHPLLKGEQWVVTGHNIHPCAKTKLGMSYEAVMRYAPEYNHTFELNWILVKKDILFNNLEDDQIEQLIAFSGYQNAIDDAYHLIPVHPYQYEHILPEVYKEEIAAQDIIMIDYEGGRVKSTSSFRTVCPIDARYPIVKLPVHSQMTSTIRSISNNSVINSKAISDYFKWIYESDDALAQLSTPIMEYGGMTYEHESEAKQRNLSFILRENSTQEFKQYDDVFAATCLFERDETDDKIYKRLIHQSNQSASAWFYRYTKLLLHTAIPLMATYGIGLEAHMQNISIAFLNGNPVHLYYRDFGGLRIDISRTAGKLQLNEGLTCTTTEGMHEKVVNTLIANHLTTVIDHISQDYELHPDELWRIAAELLMHTFEMLSGNDIQQDFESFTSAHLKQKALMTMRLSSDKNDLYIYKENPLHAQFIKK